MAKRIRLYSSNSPKIGKATRLVMAQTSKGLEGVLTMIINYTYLLATVMMIDIDNGNTDGGDNTSDSDGFCLTVISIFEDVYWRGRGIMPLNVWPGRSVIFRSVANAQWLGRNLRRGGQRAGL